MCKICALCNKPKAHTYDLRGVVIQGSAEKQKNSMKIVMRSPEVRAFSGATFLCVFQWSPKCRFFQIFLTDNFLIFFAN